MEDNKNPILRKCSIGDLIIEDNEPILRIDTCIFNNNEWVIEHEGYAWLVPFEGCSFRVSKNKDGECPISSTKIIGLGHITQCTFYENYGWQYENKIHRVSIKLELLRCLITTAISEFCSIEDLIPPLTYDSEEDSIIAEYIKQVIKWIDYNFYDKYYIRPW